MNDNADKLLALSDTQRRILAERLRNRMPSRARLLAFAAQRDNAPLDSDELSAWLSTRLPRHMVPDAIVVLDTLPRLPNGKIDAGKLSQTPAPASRTETTSSPDSGIVAARSKPESILARIWSDLLGVDPISMTDNFFELGGDSLVSIRMISMARQEGLQIKPGDLPDNPTIEALAQLAGETDNTAPRHTSASEAPPTPIQSWHLNRAMPKPAHWNQAVRLELAQSLGSREVEAAVQAVFDRHPGLRTRFHQVDGSWRQSVLPQAKLPLQRFDLQDEAHLSDLVQSVSQGFDLQGQLCAFCDISYAGSDTSELLVIANHLVIDTVSWSVLLNDLAAALLAAANNQQITLPPSHSSLDWALEVARYANSARAASDVAPWFQAAVPASPETDFGTEASADSVTVELDPATTTALLGPANAAFNTQPLDLLIWALSEAQSARTGQATVQIDLEGHGRQPGFSDTDLTRTVGWLTAYFPVTLSLDSTHSMQRGKAVKESLRRFLDKGVSFGAVCHTSELPATREGLARHRNTDVLFNYAGPASELTYDLFKIREIEQTGLRAPENPRSHLFEFNAEIVDGRFQITLIFGRADENRDEALRFLTSFTGTLKDISDLCVAAGAGGFTPSDFPEADISQDELDTFLDEL